MAEPLLYVSGSANLNMQWLQLLRKRMKDFVYDVVIEGTFSSHKDIAAHIIRPFGFLARLLVREQYSAARSVKNFHKLLLVIPSTEDKVAPCFMGQKIYTHTNVPKSFYEIRHAHINGQLYYADSIAAKIDAMESK